MAGMTTAGLLMAVCVGLVRAQEMERVWEYILKADGVQVRGAAVDPQSGGTSITGYASGAFPGHTFLGGDSDVFIAHIPADGSSLSLTTAGTADRDRGYGIAIKEDGTRYTITQTRKASGECNVVILREQPDGPMRDFLHKTGGCDYHNDVAVNKAGHVVVVGDTDAAFEGHTNAGGEDMFVSMFNADMTLAWTVQMGTDQTDWATAVVMNDAGDVFVTVETDGAFGDDTPTGTDDVYIMKFSVDGSPGWRLRLVATDQNDWGNDMALSPDGTYLILVGMTRGSLPGYVNAGEYDIYVSKVMVDGTHMWTTQMGSDQRDEAFVVTFTSAGDVFIAGTTLGNMGVPVASEEDAILIKMRDDGTPNWIWQDSFDKTIHVRAMVIDDNNDIIYTAYDNSDTLHVRKVSPPTTSSTTSTPPRPSASTASKKVSTMLNIGGAALPILLHLLYWQATLSQ